MVDLTNTPEVRERFMRDVSDHAGWSMWRAGQMFDRWLAAVVAAAKAEALEEAAQEYWLGQLSGIFMGRDEYPREWLRARAAAFRSTIPATADTTKQGEE